LNIKIIKYFYGYDFAKLRIQAVILYSVAFFEMTRSGKDFSHISAKICSDGIDYAK
jgi:hypothetical protein